MQTSPPAKACRARALPQPERPEARDHRRTQGRAPLPNPSRPAQAETQYALTEPCGWGRGSTQKRSEYLAAEQQPVPQDHTQERQGEQVDARIGLQDFEDEAPDESPQQQDSDR